MAISPVGDIVMDVVRAADPAEAQAARARLAAGAPAGAETFSVNESTGSAKAPVPKRVEAKPMEIGAQQPFQRFEAMVLQNFIDSMLPDGNEAFGGGMAGGMWKGLMAEKLAGVMSERGGIGIANRLLTDHYTVDGKAVGIGPVSEAPSQARAGEAMLSSALMNEIERKAAGTMRPGAANDDS